MLSKIVHEGSCVDRAEQFLREVCPDTAERALVEAIVNDPSDEATRLVYADWLEERGDPRSEYIRLRTIVEKSEGDQTHTDRLAALSEKYDSSWLALVGNPVHEFQALSDRVAKFEEFERGYTPFLHWKRVGCFFDVHFSGCLFNWGEDEEDVGHLLRLLARKEIAPLLHSLLIDGHEDRGYPNGTLEINFTELFAFNACFANLIAFATQRNEGVIIRGYWSREDKPKTLTQLLNHAPLLESLTLPSAPEDEFFVGDPHPLRELRIHAGYDHRDFILNLSRSERFPQLRSLEFQDFCEEELDDWEEMATPSQHYAALLRSPVGRSLGKMVFTQVQLTDQEIASLMAIRSEGVEFRKYTEGGRP
jgi:uncharacterized protein (TIGR02996 family)